MITVYQVQLTDEQYDRVNAVGHEAAANEIPAYRAHLECSFFGAAKFQPEFFASYAPVAKFDTEDLEEAFTIGNIFEGFEDQIERIAPMHSVSVGDILEKNGKFFMVDSFGFKQVAV